MFIFRHILLAAATTFSPGLYKVQCSALLAGNLHAYAATLAPGYRVLDLGGKIEYRAQILAIFSRWFQDKTGRIESCTASAPSARLSARGVSLPLHIIENIAVAIPTEGLRKYRIDLHAIERWRLVGGRWRAVESRVESQSVTPI